MTYYSGAQVEKLIDYWRNGDTRPLSTWMSIKVYQQEYNAANQLKEDTIKTVREAVTDIVMPITKKAGVRCDTSHRRLAIFQIYRLDLTSAYRSCASCARGFIANVTIQDPTVAATVTAASDAYAKFSAANNTFNALLR